MMKIVDPAVGSDGDRNGGRPADAEDLGGAGFRHDDIVSNARGNTSCVEKSKLVRCCKGL